MKRIAPFFKPFVGITKVTGSIDPPASGYHPEDGSHKGPGSLEARTYISSLEGSDPEALGAWVRGHWSVENHLHWALDVVFREDASRIRKDHAPRNLSLLRKLALMMVRKETSHKRGVQTKRKRAAWDPDYLLKLLAAGLAS